MSLKATRMALTNTHNKGHFLSAKIYSDMKNGCSCGAKAFVSETVKGYVIPVCPSCKKNPELFVISASVIDLSGKLGRIKIRHSQDGARLSDFVDVLATLKQIDIEIKKGIFDIRRYTSSESREGFKFSKIVEDYLTFHDRRLARSELSPGGLKDKNTLIKNHLLPYFNETDIVAINDRMIRGFYESYTDRLRTRDKAILELKTIYNFAVDDGRADKLPKFPKIAPSKMVSVQKFLDLKDQNLVISKIENGTYKAAIKTLALYGLRPCEVRSLKWKDIDIKNDVFYVQSHISLNSDIAGRKSQANAAHELPIMDEFRAILKTIVRPIDSNEYIFKGEQGGAIGGNVLTRAWNVACKAAKVKGVSLYQGTKHSTLSRLANNASDATLIKLSGHTNTRIMRRYAQSKTSDVRKLLES